MGMWASAAYLSSNYTKKWNEEMKIWRTRVDDDQKRAIEANIIHVSDNYDDDDVIAAFELDWHTLKWDWLGFILSESQETLLRNILKENYSIILRVFTHYCGLGQVGKRYGLMMVEFGHLLHMADVLNIQNDFDIIEELYIRPVKHRQIMDAPLMTRGHFAQSLIATALMQGGMASIGDNLTDLLVKSLGSLWKTLQSSYIIYSSHEASMREIVRPSYEPINRLIHFVS